MRAWWEERIGSLIAAIGIGWAVYAATLNADLANVFTQSFVKVLITSGPLEVCAIGVLVWLHAKWRRSITLR